MNNNLSQICENGYWIGHQLLGDVIGFCAAAHLMYVKTGKRQKVSFQESRKGILEYFDGVDWVPKESIVNVIDCGRDPTLHEWPNMNGVKRFYKWMDSSLSNPKTFDIHMNRERIVGNNLIGLITHANTLGDIPNHVVNEMVMEARKQYPNHKIVAIGNMDNKYIPEGVEDMRQINGDIKWIVEMVRKLDLLITPHTGPCFIAAGFKIPMWVYRSKEAFWDNVMNYDTYKVERWWDRVTLFNDIKIPEINYNPYQSDFFAKGERFCQQRWDLISPYIFGNTALEVGSAEGFFTYNLLKKGLLVVSIEKSERRVDFQKRLFESNNLKPYICHGNLDCDFYEKMSNSCEYIDNILLLSVLHWLDDPDKILRNSCKLGGRIFVEFPDIADVKAHNQKYINRIRLYGSEENYIKSIIGDSRKLTLLGVVSAHTSNTRKVYMIHGDFSKDTKSPYFSYSNKNRNYKIEYNDGVGITLFKNGKIKNNYFSGFNFIHLKNMNVVYPNDRWFFDEAMRELKDNNISIYDYYTKPKDIQPQNFICGNTCKIIDIMDMLVKNNLLEKITSK
jgi:2-polyprenyl-3-methyl-5-hydroxy-6-metoxy-1,4-benzoquinol methylase